MFSLEKMINRCRPGHGASCALCCGSHNYAAAPEDIESIFIDRGLDRTISIHGHPEDSSGKKLFDDAIQCPNVGMSREDPGIICCLVYDCAPHDKKISSFFNGTCKNFFCAAWDSLTDEEVLFAAELMGDWYYYSLFINDIESLKEEFSTYGTPQHVPVSRLAEIKEKLVQRLIDEDGK